MALAIVLTERQSKLFWRRVQKADGCWHWTGPRTSGGYGSYTWRDLGVVRGTPAHRVAYVLAKGRIPDGLTIDHLCATKTCVNPAHLEAVTHAENMGRAISRRYEAHDAGMTCGWKSCAGCKAVA